MHHSSSADAHWSCLLSRLPETVDLEHSARDLGALTRRRSIRNATDLLRLALAYGPCGMSLRGAAAWATLSGVGAISDVAVLKRLRGAAGWLEHIAGQLLMRQTASLAQSAPLDRPLRLSDGSSVTALGGSQWRVHATYDPALGRFEHLEITDVQGAERLMRGPVTADEIRIADRNYARLNDMRHIVDHGGDFILRTGWRKVTLRARDGGDFDLFKFLAPVAEDAPADVDVAVVDHGGGRDLPVRLIAMRKPDGAAERERSRARRRSSKTRKVLSPKTLVAANYMLLLTSLPRDTYPLQKVSTLYKIRWQVELAFKRLKSLIHIDRLPARDNQLARSWLAAHLIVAVLTDELSQDFLESSP